MTITQFFAANGILFSLVFGTLSFTAVFLVAWRIIKNFHQYGDVDKFVENLEQEFETRGPQGVYEFCEREAVETKRVLPKLFFAAFSEGRQGKIAARDAIADCIETEIMPSLHSLLPFILLLAKIAPMIGLLGTVSGMIGAFQTIAGATKVDPSALANDIGMALFTTAEGLIIAIPLIFAYTLFREQVNKFEPQLQRASQISLKMLGRMYQTSAA